MRKPEKPMMFIGNDELTKKMIAHYWVEFRQYRRSRRLIEFVVITVFIILLVLVGVFI